MLDNILDMLKDGCITWQTSRQCPGISKWCQNHYTDIVTVHSENVTCFLKENVKNNISLILDWNAKDQWHLEVGCQRTNHEISKLGTQWAQQQVWWKLWNYTAATNNNGKWNDDNNQLAKHPLCQRGKE